VLTSAPRNPSDCCTHLADSAQQLSRKRRIPNSGHDGMRMRSQPVHVSWNEIADEEVGDVNEWICNTEEVAPSPPTSMATDPRTALGTVYKGCKCPSHQEIYRNWPMRDAELTIAQCMKICVYCGKDDFVSSAELCKREWNIGGCSVWTCRLLR
jgi:hypothetical protein